ncbi:MAG: hypothetical protein ACNI25_13230 [Halarcobacter sp.]
MFKILITLIFFQLLVFSSEINLNDKNLDIKLEPTDEQKTKEDYQVKNKYEKDPSLDANHISKKTKKKIKIDGDVGIDKNNLEKPIDSVKINMGTNF